MCVLLILDQRVRIQLTLVGVTPKICQPTTWVYFGLWSTSVCTEKWCKILLVLMIFKRKKAFFWFLFILSSTILKWCLPGVLGMLLIWSSFTDIQNIFYLLLLLYLNIYLHFILLYIFTKKYYFIIQWQKI
jgi:hypothetical protein